MYRLLRFIILGVWTMPEPEPKCRHSWVTVRNGTTTHGPVVVLQCAHCGDCKIVD